MSFVVSRQRTGTDRDRAGTAPRLDRLDRYSSCGLSTQYRNGRPKSRDGRGGRRLAHGRATPAPTVSHSVTVGEKCWRAKRSPLLSNLMFGKLRLKEATRDADGGAKRFVYGLFSSLCRIVASYVDTKPQAGKPRKNVRSDQPTAARAPAARRIITANATADSNTWGAFHGSTRRALATHWSARQPATALHR